MGKLIILPPGCQLGEEDKDEGEEEEVEEEEEEEEKKEEEEEEEEPVALCYTSTEPHVIPPFSLIPFPVKLYYQIQQQKAKTEKKNNNVHFLFYTNITITASHLLLTQYILIWLTSHHKTELTFFIAFLILSLNHNLWWHPSSNLTKLFKTFVLDLGMS